jgi:hypothetical protein
MWRMPIAVFEVTLGLVGLALVILGIYGIVRNKFAQPTSGGIFGGTFNVPLSAFMMILGLGALGYCGYLAANGSAQKPIAAPTSTAGISTSPSVSTSPTSPFPTTTSPNDIATPTPSSMTLTCSLSSKQLRPGATVQLTYHVDSPVARQVGLGAGLYDHQDNDHSNGDGDVSSIMIQQGQSSLSRPVTIPANLPPGKYELDAEIWPANEIGQDNVNDLTDTPCASFNVP